MIRLVLTCFLIILAASQSVAAPPSDRDLATLWREGNVPRMEQIAAGGDVRAQRWLGLMLHNRGRYDEAIHWYSHAVAQGDGYSAARIAFFYQHGIGRPKDKKTAIDWHRRGAALGHATSQRQYAFALRSGDVVARDDREAYRWYSAAARQRDLYSYVPLAEMLSAGAGAPRDLKRAYAYAKAAELAAEDSETALIGKARALQAHAAAELEPSELREADQLFQQLRPDLSKGSAMRSLLLIALAALVLVLALKPPAERSQDQE